MLIYNTKIFYNFALAIVISTIIGEKGYLSTEVQLDLFETANIKLESPYQLKQKDWKPIFIPFEKARKRIETLFSQLNDQFRVITNYAKDTRGLFARIIGKILSAIYTATFLSAGKVSVPRQKRHRPLSS